MKMSFGQLADLISIIYNTTEDEELDEIDDVNDFCDYLTEHANQYIVIETEE